MHTLRQAGGWLLSLLLFFCLNGRVAAATTSGGTTTTTAGTTTTTAGTTTTVGITTGGTTTTTAGKPLSPTDFEKWLDEQKFPESYRPALRALHEQYPHWVFRAQHTGLTWQEVLDAQSRVGVSLVPTGSLDSWKSCEKGAFDLQTGRWYGLDSAAWVAADRGVIAHYLDPRNALTATGIFQFENLAYSDTCTVEGVKAILAGTFMATEEYAAIFMNAGKEAGVSPYHLASRARQEQGASGNALGRGTVIGYTGYYNFFNVQAFATDTLSPLQNGARYAAATDAATLRPWTSPTLSIRGGASILGSSYIKKGQNTLYLQKFDVTDGGNGLYIHQYMTNILAPTSEAATLAAAYSDEVKAGAMEFCIPVYEDMPDKACVKPTSAGSNNNLLAAITVEGQELKTEFTPYTMSYELKAAATASSIRVGATTHTPAATVSGTGTVPLKSGLNTLKLTVTAPSGATRIYTLTVYRTPTAGGDAEKAPTVESDVYRFGDTIQGVAPGTSAADFLKAFAVSDDKAELVLVDAAGLPVTGVVGTGAALHVIVGDTLFSVHPVVVRGDVSGDGTINSLDLLKIQKHILGVAALGTHAQTAADVNHDGKVNALDLLRTQRHILKLVTIEQVKGEE